MKTLIALVLTSIFFISCSGTKDALNQPMESEVKQWAVDKQFTIENEWAQPLRGNQINLIDTPNFLTVENDTVSAALPFYGVRQTGTTLNSGGIEFEGIPKNYQMIYNQKKKSSTIKFDISEKGENYQVTIILYDSKNSSISVNSSQRDIMRYQGTVEALPEEK